VKGQPLIYWGLLLGSWGLVRADVLINFATAEVQTRPKPFSKAEITAKQQALVGGESQALLQQPYSFYRAKTPLTGSKDERSSSTPKEQPFTSVINRQSLSISYTSDILPQTVELPFVLPKTVDEIAPSRITSRLSGDLWLFTRSANNPLSAANLGESQAGGRFKFSMFSNPRRPTISASMRFATPLKGVDPEISPGISIKTGQNLPIEFIVERRIRTNNGNKDQWTLLIATGVSERDIGQGLSLEGYGQAGFVGTKKTIPFAQLGAGLHRSVLDQKGLQLKAGAGFWIDQQNSSGRVDIGPEVVALIKAGDRPLRLSGQWRIKVAGNAEPGSGPALSIATSF
jgi:hypothetical protein